MAPSDSLFDDDAVSLYYRLNRRRRLAGQGGGSSSSRHSKKPRSEYHDEEDDKEEEVGSVDEEAGGNNGSNSVTITDPEVLDCPVCCDPLTSPVFQCENGHVACPSCCTTLVNECPTCCSKIGCRNRALEKVLEASKVICKFAKYGCKETVNYSKKHDHEENCSHVPCFCPLAVCNFIGSSNQLYRHFTDKHKISVSSFLYNNRFCITLNVDDEFQILQEGKEGTLFILSNSKSIEHHGNAISISCIASTNSEPSIPYNIWAVHMTGLYTLKFKSFSTFMWYDPKPSTGFLVVPSYFFNSDGQLKLDVYIFRSCEARRINAK